MKGHRQLSVAVPAGGITLLLIGLAAGCAVLPGHWRPGWNKPLPPNTTPRETAATWRAGPPEMDDGRFIALAISGGGSRAANFGAAVMLELRRRHLLEQVDVISGVSGGTLPAVYYGLGDKAGPFTVEAVRAAMGQDFQGSWLRRWFLPQNIFRYWLTDFTRSDIMVQVFNNRLYHDATFADLKPHPKILLNATLRNAHTRFTFTDERFAGSLHSELARYTVANAVNASSAFPGIFDDVTLQNYVEPPEYYHLYDGGPIDNLGVQAILEYLNRLVPGKAMNVLFPNGCLVFIVDASPASGDAELATRQSSRKWIDYLINTNALDATDAMLQESRRSLLSLVGIPVSAQDQEIRGRLPLNDLNQCGCEVRHVALRHLPFLAETPEQEEIAEVATRVKTRFQVSANEQHALFEGAGLIMQELEDGKLLPDASFRTECAR